MNSAFTHQERETLEMLIKRYLAGNELAAKEIYNRSYKIVRNTAFGFFKDKDVAKDAMQNSYIKIFKNLNRIDFSSDGSTLAWMKRISLNECISIIRKNTRWSNIQTIPKANTVENAHGLGYEELAKLLKRLPVKQREAFDLYAIQGYRHVEIGKILGVGASNSRTLVSRARKALKKYCKTYNYTSLAY